MQCENILNKLDDYLDGDLLAGDLEPVQQHLNDCEHCRAEYQLAQDLIQQCQNQPVIEPRPGYESRMLSFLDQQQHPQAARPRYSVPAWFAAGFGSAIAATLLVVWFVAFDIVGPAQDNMPVMTVEIPTMQSRKVALVFNSPRHIQNAAMTIELPAGTEIVGYPGQRTLKWQTTLKQGSNRLSLPIIIRSKQGGILLAKISHEGQTRTFKLNLVPIPSSSQLLPILSS